MLSLITGSVNKIWSAQSGGTPYDTPFKRIKLHKYPFVSPRIFLLFLFSMSQRSSNRAVLKRILRLHAEALAVLEIYAENDERNELEAVKKYLNK
jgi:hypothetical protein